MRLFFFTIRRLLGNVQEMYNGKKRINSNYILVNINYIILEDNSYNK